METATNQNLPGKPLASHKLNFPQIERITLSHVPTDQAAFYLNRKPQTMRHWACFENGLLKPIRINGRLAWPVSEIKKLLGVEV